MIRKLIIAASVMLAVSPAFAEEISKADLDQFLIVQKRVAPVAQSWKYRISNAPENQKDALRAQAFKDVEKTIKQKPGMEPAQYFATARVVKKQADAAKAKK